MSTWKLLPLQKAARLLGVSVFGFKEGNALQMALAL
jgi:hypothetical protein